MPQDAPQSLSREETVNLMAYIFSKNNFPAGEIDLSERGEMLGTIKYVDPNTRVTKDIQPMWAVNVARRDTERIVDEFDGTSRSGT